MTSQNTYCDPFPGERDGLTSEGRSNSISHISTLAKNYDGDNNLNITLVNAKLNDQPSLKLTTLLPW